jgi:Tol biopolymer transport system component
VFVHDRRTGRTERVSVTSKGKQAGADRTNNGSNAPSISGDGRYVAFHSADSNLVPGDTNRTFDVFVHDRKTRRTTRVSVSSAGRQANGESVGAPSFSADGRYVAFNSLATNLVPGDTEDNDILDVFVRDLWTGATTIASLGAAGQHGGDSSSVSGIAFSSDDRVLAFSSFAPNFVPGDTNGTADAFLREFKAGNSSTRVEGKQQ